MRVRRGDMGGDFRAAIDGRDRDTKAAKGGRDGRQKGEAAKDGRDRDTKAAKNGRGGRQKREAAKDGRDKDTKAAKTGSREGAVRKEKSTPPLGRGGL